MKIGIDLGGTKIEIIALKKHKGTFIECYRKRISTPQGNYQQTISAIQNLVLECEQKFQTLASVGIGIPGAISATTDLVKNANSTCLIGHPLQQDIEKLLARPIRISNDANCMTVSEATDGSGKNNSVVFGVILGTGVGGGIAINKHVIPGKNLIAGEWGHNPMPFLEENEAKVKCYCGQTNCIETFLSGPGLINRFNQLRENKTTTTSVQDLVKLSETNDKIAQQILTNYEINLAKALASVINILDPDTIILAGGLSNIQRLYSNIPKLWQQFVFSDEVSTQLHQAEHGDSSGVRGAAWLW